MSVSARLTVVFAHVTRSRAGGVARGVRGRAARRTCARGVGFGAGGADGGVGRVRGGGDAVFRGFGAGAVRGEERAADHGGRSDAGAVPGGAGVGAGAAAVGGAGGTGQAPGERTGVADMLRAARESR